MQTEEEKAIVAFASDRLPHHDTTYIWFEPEEHANGPDLWKASIRHDPIWPDRHMCGQLDHLPAELLARIVTLCDIPTVMSISQTNRFLRRFILGILEFRSLYTHAANLICALTRSRLSSAYSLEDVHHAIRLSKCVGCGAFAPYIFLPTLERACNQCLLYAFHFRMHYVSAIREILARHRLELPAEENLTTLRVFPGRYMHSTVSPDSSHRMSITSVATVIELYNDESLTKALESEFTATRQPWSRTREDMPNPPELASMAACATPVADKAGLSADKGVYCIGCREEYLYMLRNRSKFPGYQKGKGSIAYSGTGFLDHFRSCAWSQKMWTEHQQSPNRNNL